jgi:hypothetical protein
MRLSMPSHVHAIAHGSRAPPRAIDGGRPTRTHPLERTRASRSFPEKERSFSVGSGGRAFVRRPSRSASISTSLSTRPALARPQRVSQGARREEKGPLIGEFAKVSAPLHEPSCKAALCQSPRDAQSIKMRSQRNSKSHDPLRDPIAKGSKIERLKKNRRVLIGLYAPRPRSLPEPVLETSGVTTNLSCKRECLRSGFYCPQSIRLSAKT